MSKVKARHELFVNQMIAHGDQVRAYQAAYPKAGTTTARVESYRLLQKPHISKAIKDAADRIKHEAETKAVEELKDRIKADILTREEKQKTVAKIVRGEFEVEKVFFSKQGVPIKIKVKPDHIEILKAIDLDNKMAGDYAPTEHEFKNAPPVTLALPEGLSINFPSNTDGE